MSWSGIKVAVLREELCVRVRGQVAGWRQALRDMPRNPKKGVSSQGTVWGVSRAEAVDDIWMQCHLTPQQADQVIECSTSGQVKHGFVG